MMIPFSLRHRGCRMQHGPHRTDGTMHTAAFIRLNGTANNNAGAQSSRGKTEPLEEGAGIVHNGSAPTTADGISSLSMVQRVTWPLRSTSSRQSACNSCMHGRRMNLSPGVTGSRQTAQVCNCSSSSLRITSSRSVGRSSWSAKRRCCADARRGAPPEQPGTRPQRRRVASPAARRVVRSPMSSCGGGVAFSTARTRRRPMRPHAPRRGAPCPTCRGRRLRSDPTVTKSSISMVVGS